MKVDFQITKAGILLTTGWLFFVVFTGKAQSNYRLVGSARASSTADCYNVTEERPRQPQTGAVWCNQLLRISESFKLELTANFGSNNNGADGIIIAMQTVGTTALGVPGLGIGFAGIRPSFGIEFDTHYNSEFGDPAMDHIALVRDINNHRLNASFAPPVPISTTSTSIKDGRDHLITINWNAAKRLINVYVDCVLRVSQSVDLVNDVFKGRQEVFWGVTSSTGNAGNVHTVCLPKDIIIRDTIQACQTDTVTLLAGISIDNTYDWKPATGLSNSRIRNPRLKPTTNQLYTVSYVDYCSRPKTDSVFVKGTAPTISLGEDRDVCEKEVVELSPTFTQPEMPVKFYWSTGDTTRTLKPTASGLYALQVSVNGCSTSDSAVVTFHPLPTTGVVNEPTYDCPRELPVLLDPLAVGSDLQFAWTPGGTKEPTLSASAPGGYTVKISTAFGCSVEQRFSILDNCPPAALISVPDAFTPNGDGRNEVFEWKSDVEIEARMTIYNRWGEVLFSSANARDFWNGTCNGKQCPSTVYNWRLDYRTRTSKDNQWFVSRGELLLLR